MAELALFLLLTFTIGGSIALIKRDPNLGRAIRFEIAPWSP